MPADRWKIWSATCTVVVFIAVGGYLYERNRRQAAAEELVEIRGEVDELRSSVAALEPSGARMIVLHGASARDSLETDAPAADAGTGVEAMTREQAQAQRDRRQLLIEERFTREAYESGWASESEAAIEAAFEREELAGLTLVGADCRSTLCRLTIDHDDISGPRTQLLPPMLPEFSGGTASSEPNADGTRRTTMYLLRPGASFPESL